MAAHKGDRVRLTVRLPREYVEALDDRAQRWRLDRNTALIVFLNVGLSAPLPLDVAEKLMGHALEAPNESE